MAPPTLTTVVPVLADAVVWIVAVPVVLSLLLLLLIIVAPWKRVRDEPPLDEEVETRLLLGEDPDEIDRDLAARESRRAPVADLRPDDRD
jgi:hypothetical protein